MLGPGRECDNHIMNDSQLVPAETRGTIEFIGTATVLIRCAGFTLLTDPNFLHAGETVRLGYGLRARRRTDPSMSMQDLPPLDGVIVSHLHEDHFDRVAARELSRDLPLITTPKAARRLRSLGFYRAEGIARWESRLLEKAGASVRITAMPGRHGPGIIDRFLPEVMGTLLEFQKGGSVLARIYISGDTLVFIDLREIPLRYPDIDLALLHLGGTRIVGMLLTMDGAQGLEALRIIAPKRAVPIHYDDYTVFKSPLEDFRREVERAGLSDKVRYLARGDVLDI